MCVCDYVTTALHKNCRQNKGFHPNLIKHSPPSPPLQRDAAAPSASGCESDVPVPAPCSMLAGDSPLWKCVYVSMGRKQDEGVSQTRL